MQSRLCWKVRPRQKDRTQGLQAPVKKAKAQHLPKNPLPEGDKILSYMPEQEANYVLEVNAGLADKYGWQIGDEVKIGFDKK